MKRGGILFVAILFLGLISLLPSYSQVLYDDFSGPSINRDKWRQTEFVREVDPVGQRLLLKQASPNPFTIESYPSRTFNDLIFIYDPVPVTAIQADLTIEQSSVTNNGWAQARLGGGWYNDGTAWDIWAEVALREDATGLKAVWSVIKLLDQYAQTREVLGTGYFSTPIRIGTIYTLSISYDSVNHQFLFKVEDEELTFGPNGLPSRYGEPRMTDRKMLSTEVQIDNSSSSTFISATFDKVYKNGLPYDDFSLPTIDSTKWTAFEFGELAREISNGHARFKVMASRSFPWPVHSGLEFTDPSSINLVGAKVTPITYQNENGDDVAGYIAGFFYNDGSQRGGMNGEVEARIQVGGSGIEPVAEWEVRKYLNPDGNFVIVLNKGVFKMPIILGNSYLLFLGWSGTEFVFSIKNAVTGNVEDARHRPIDNIEPPTTPLREIGARTQFNNLETVLEVYFDEVMVSDSIPTSPANVSASDGTYLDRVEVTWTVSSWLTSYKVYRAPSLAGTKTYLGRTSRPPYNDRTALPGKTYDYWVKAENTFGTTEFSLPDKGYRSTRIPSPPESVLASDGTYTDRVEVTWLPSEKATSYTVYRSISRWGWKAALGSTSVTIYNDTTAVPGKTYYYWIKASNSLGSSRFSSSDTGYRP
jgi:hypothetical protein